MISFTSLATSAILWMATPSPEPTIYPEFEGDPNSVTPGVIGFAATLFIALATLLIITDMNRRVRRVRYRELAQEAIREEQALAAEQALTGAGAAATATDVAEPDAAAANTDAADGSNDDVPPTQRAD
ncbi:hypothetical protein A20C1_12852 [marine actinobacterium PHSC20C1]|nr:hypothetical protein A20C1_12852 [marine actinobacterium PHSC20C1]